MPRKLKFAVYGGTSNFSRTIRNGPGVAKVRCFSGQDISLLRSSVVYRSLSFQKWTLVKFNVWKHCHPTHAHTHINTHTQTYFQHTIRHSQTYRNILVKGMCEAHWTLSNKGFIEFHIDITLYLFWLNNNT